MTLSIVVAMTPSRAIGLNGKLPWKCPVDMDRFKMLTIGRTVVMGMRTYEGLRPGGLKKRRQIVLSRSASLIDGNDTSFVANVEELWPLLPAKQEVFIIGGGHVYRQFLPIVDTVYVSILRTDTVGDTFFPPIDMSEWNTICSESFPDHVFKVLKRCRS